MRTRTMALPYAMCWIARRTAGFSSTQPSCRLSHRLASHGMTTRYSTPSLRKTRTRLWQSTTVREALQSSMEILQTRDVPEPTESAIHILSKVLQLDWETGWRQLLQISQQSPLHATQGLADQCMTDAQIAQFDALLRRRYEHHEPIQYIVGQWDFLDHTFEIRPPLLCPRPETEELVLHALRDVQAPAKILDVGCGTGCIGISIAAQLDDCTVVAIDPEGVAIATSNANAQRILGDAQSYRTVQCAAAELDGDDVPFDMVVSNPPYIPTKDMATLESTVVAHESPSALCGGADGLDVVRDIVAQLPRWCRTGAICWMEVDPTHPSMIEEWLSAPSSASSSSSAGDVVWEESVQDMFGLDRFVKLRVVNGR